MSRLRKFVEFNAFGVCAYVGEKCRISTSRIRLYFIYLSFLTFGSPIILYFFIAFWMNIKHYIFSDKRNPIMH